MKKIWNVIFHSEKENERVKIPQVSCVKCKNMQSLGEKTQNDKVRHMLCDETFQVSPRDHYLIISWFNHTFKTLDLKMDSK